MTKIKFTPTLLTAAALVAGCASTPPETIGPVRAEKAVAVTASHQLIKFNAGRPQQILATIPIRGLASGEVILGIDYRVAKDALYALGSSGRLYTLDEDSGELKAVGSTFTVPLGNAAYGFDFNPTVDRIRVINAAGQNMRLHPDTGAVIDSNPNTDGVQTDGALAYVAGDANAGAAPRLVGAAYSYNKFDPKITTNYVLDATTGALVLQGSREGTQPVVSPNTGQLRTVGKLGVDFDDAHFDIQALSDVAFASLSGKGLKGNRWYSIDTQSGKATFIGTIGANEPLRGVALEP